MIRISASGSILGNIGGDLFGGDDGEDYNGDEASVSTQEQTETLASARGQEATTISSVEHRAQTAASSFTA